MIPAFSFDWILRSLAIGAGAVLCVRLCPVSWRGRVRRVVPAAALGALVLLTLALLRPLPSVEIPAPAVVAEIARVSATWPVVAWLVGAALFLLRLCGEQRAVSSLLEHTRPVEDSAWKTLLDECCRTLRLRGTVRLRIAGPGFVPSATGLLRRVVLLPEESCRWTVDQRRLVLLHELGHFRRGDLWTHALARLACALHWFNPFAWVLARQLAIEREFACDELVVERGAVPRDYATLLWEMAGGARRPVAAAFLAMASVRAGKLEQRVRRILEPGRKAGRLLRLADNVLCIGLAGLLLICTACKPVMRVIGPGSWDPKEIETRLTADPFPADAPVAGE